MRILNKVLQKKSMKTLKNVKKKKKACIVYYFTFSTLMYAKISNLCKQRKYRKKKNVKNIL